MSGTQDDRVVYVIQKGPRQEIRASLSEFRGRLLGDLRLYVLNKQGEWVPTAKGCAVGVEQLEDLVAAATALREAAIRERLIQRSAAERAILASRESAPDPGW